METIKRFFKFANNVRRHFVKDRGLILASSMVFSTLFSIVPFFASFTILLSSSKFVNIEVINEWLEKVALPQIIPEGQQGLVLLFEDFVKQAATFGWISFGVFIVTTAMLIKKINDSFNYIYRASYHRKRFATRIATYTPIIATSILVIGVALTVVQFIFTWLKSLSLSIFNNTPTADFFLIRFIPWVLLFFILFLLFKTTPSTYVQTKSAFIGSSLTTMAWGVLNSGFAFAINTIFNYEKIYGSLASVLLFLMWLYLLWIILFFALEIAYVHQYKETIYDDCPSRQISTGLNILYSIQTQYNQTNSPIPLRKLVREFQVPSDDVNIQLRLFVKEGFIVKNSYFFPSYSPHVNLFSLKVLDILAVQLGPTTTDIGGQIAHKIFDQMQLKSDSSTTLADFIPQ